MFRRFSALGLSKVVVKKKDGVATFIDNLLSHIDTPQTNVKLYPRRWEQGFVIISAIEGG